MPFRFVSFFGTAGASCSVYAGVSCLEKDTYVTELPSTSGDRGTSSTGPGLLLAAGQGTERPQA